MIKCNKTDCEIKGSEGIVGAEFGVILYNLLKNGNVSEYILDMVIAEAKNVYRNEGGKND